MNEIKQQVKKAGKYPVENFSAAEDDEPFENGEIDGYSRIAKSHYKIV